MPSLTEHTSSEFVKLMFIGASGTGKTGALVSLLAAGYELRIIDLDSGLDALVNHAKEQRLDLSKVQYQSFRDKMKSSPTGTVSVGAPKAYANTLTALEKWDDGSDPASWGPNVILVIDSLTNLGQAAFRWAKHMNPTVKDPRQWYSVAQSLIDDLLMNVTGEFFKTNVIIISHIEITENKDGTVKHYASAIGKALGPKIPRNFNTLLLAESSGTGANVKRKIKTMPTGMVDLKNPAPMRIDAEYPLETGLATIFAKLKEK